MGLASGPFHDETASRVVPAMMAATDALHNRLGRDSANEGAARNRDKSVSATMRERGWIESDMRLYRRVSKCAEELY
jgi:hypothetical protein